MNECVLISFFYVTENQTTKLVSGGQCDGYDDGPKYSILRTLGGKNPNQTTGVVQVSKPGNRGLKTHSQDLEYIHLELNLFRHPECLKNLFRHSRIKHVL